MKYEFHAHFPFALQDSVTRAAATDFLPRKRSHPPQAWPELDQVEDEWERMQLLSQTLLPDESGQARYKDQARTGARNDPGGYAFWLTHAAGEFLNRQRRWLDTLNLAPPDNALPELTLLPKGSFTLSFHFTLASPYLSKDDTALHLLDNPVRKEWVFKVPYIASTQWKGTLQAVMVQEFANWWQNLTEDQRRERVQQKAFVVRRIQLTRLFGTEIGQQQVYLSQLGGERLMRWYQRYVRRFISRTGFVAGRLYFYPTFFDRLGLEVINPHDRKTGAGSQPILFECVPAGTTGRFSLLYVPLDSIGEEEATTRQQVAADLTLLAQGLEALFTVYGFGAKTSSGYGLAVNTVAGGEIVVGGLTYAVESPTPAAALSAPPQPELPRYLVAADKLHPDFVAETGGIKSEAEYQKLIEARRQNYGKPHRQLYAKAKSWWEREGQRLAQQQQEPAPESQPIPIAAPPYPFVRETFDTFASLPAKAQAVADALCQPGGEA